MASKNPDSLTGQGEFTARRPGTSPMDKHGHQPGVKASPSDSIPTFSAQTLNPGTAPPAKTYTPQTLPREGLETNIEPLEGTHRPMISLSHSPIPSPLPPLPTAVDDAPVPAVVLSCVPGATSRDLYAGLGKPMQGMTAEEVRHDGQKGRKKQTLGLAKHGAGGEAMGVDERVDERQRGIEREEARPGRGDKGSRPAEDQPGYVVTGKRP